MYIDRMKSLTCLLISVSVVGCGGSSGNKGGQDMASAPPDMTIGLGPAPALAIGCTDKAGDLYTLPTLAPYTSANRGDVFHCNVSESLNVDEVNALATAYNYAGPKLQSGFWTWRIAYRTERAAPATATAPVEGDTPAVLVIPDKPLPGAPLIVFAHGSVGIAPGCGPSTWDLTTPAPDLADQHDYPVNIYALAGYGYTVIMPDYPGFAYGQPPGYFSAADEAHAVLDATRAANNVLPSKFDKVAIVGHSQGGHAAFAAQVYADSSKYGLQGSLVAVATYAPYWPTMALWGAIASPFANATTADDPIEVLYSMEYFYSAGELLDGPGHGTDNFAMPAAAKKVLVGGACYDNAGLAALGTTSSDVYTPAFVQDVGTDCAAGATDCSAPDAALWLARWKADRPALDPNGAPILVWFGALDTYLKPALAQCIQDTATAEGASGIMRYCYDANSTHVQLVRADADYVNQWVAFKAGIGSDPGDCPPFNSGFQCLVPPVNY